MLVMARGIGEGRRVALFTVLGMTLGAGLVQLPLIALGVSFLAGEAPAAFNLLRLLGAAYLVWLGAKLILSSTPSATIQEAKEITPLAAARQGMIANLLNPWPLTFMIAFLPQFVDPGAGSVALQLFVLGATQKLTGFLVLGAYAVGSATISAWMIARPRVRLWHQRAAGCFIVGLGIRMAVATR
jgi:threonine/homoserine/homoserine lactone efflux protein